jgi:hypothetical protein
MIPLAISPGALCMCRQCGAQLFVIVAKADGGRWRLRSNRVDARGRTSPAAWPVPAISS